VVERVYAGNSGTLPNLTQEF